MYIYISNEDKKSYEVAGILQSTYRHTVSPVTVQSSTVKRSELLRFFSDLLVASSATHRYGTWEKCWYNSGTLVDLYHDSWDLYHD